MGKQEHHLFAGNQGEKGKDACKHVLRNRHAVRDGAALHTNSVSPKGTITADDDQTTNPGGERESLSQCPPSLKFPMKKAKTFEVFAAGAIPLSVSRLRLLVTRQIDRGMKWKAISDGRPTDGDEK